jgi:hypothetical protein
MPHLYGSKLKQYICLRRFTNEVGLDRPQKLSTLAVTNLDNVPWLLVCARIKHIVPDSRYPRPTEFLESINDFAISVGDCDCRNKPIPAFVSGAAPSVNTDCTFSIDHRRQPSLFGLSQRVSGGYHRHNSSLLLAN